MVDEAPRSLAPPPISNATEPTSGTVGPNSITDTDADEEAALAAALAASSADQREREVDRIREDRNMAKAIEASKLSAVEYALGTIEPDDSDETDSTTGWTSSDEDEDETDATAAEDDAMPHTDEEVRQHTIERLRVLEAAGVLVTSQDEVKQEATKRRPPPPPGQKHKNIDELVKLSRSRSTKKPEQPRRRPPNRPRRKPSRDLPPLPPPAEEGEDKMEDAYDRYLALTKEVSLQPIPVATAVGRGVAVPPASPTLLPPGSPARSTSAAGEATRTSGFLSTIKNMSQRSAWTGAPTGEKRIVSGPISVSSPSFPSTPDASEASRETTSWTSLIDPPLLATLTDTERKRQESIFELITTESAHVRDLQIVVEVFFNSMQSILQPKAATVIFANIEDVLLTSVGFLSDLEARQKEDRLFVTRVGDVLDRHIVGMGIYMPYCVNQRSAAEILEGERKRDTRVEIHLLNLRKHPAARGLDLSHFLLVPMQRLTRYPLLLGQILRYTPHDHVDYAQLKTAKETAEGILAKTNEAIRDNQDSTALQKLSENLWLGEEARLDLTKPYTDPNGAKHHRRIVRDELVTKAKSGRKLRLVLTSDLLLVLHAQDASLYRMPIPVNEVRAEEGKGKRHADEFKLIHEMKGGEGDVIKVKAAGQRNATAWVRVINASRGETMG